MSDRIDASQTPHNGLMAEAAERLREVSHNEKVQTGAKIATAAAAGFLLADWLPAAGIMNLAKLGAVGMGTAFCFDIAPNLGHVTKENLTRFGEDSLLLGGTAWLGGKAFTGFAYAKAARAEREWQSMYEITDSTGTWRKTMPREWFVERANEYVKAGLPERDMASMSGRFHQIDWTTRALGARAPLSPELAQLYQNAAEAGRGAGATVLHDSMKSQSDAILANIKRAESGEITTLFQH